MNDRENRIIDAALLVFSRYGLKRATMADIAAEVGISRQTLYASFSSKDEVLAAVVRAFAARKLSAIEERWRTLETVPDKLEAYFDLAVRAYFDQLRAMPDFNDVLSGFNEEGQAEKRRAEEDKKRLLAAMLSSRPGTEEQAELNGETGCNPHALADFIVTSADGYVFSARDRDHLDHLLASLKQAVLALCGD